MPLTAANAARQAKALDRPYRQTDGTIATFRERIDAGRFAYRTERHSTEGRTRYGLIEPDDAREALAGAGASLAFAAYNECPKLVCDYADTLPTVIVHGYATVTIRPADHTN